MKNKLSTLFIVITSLLVGSLHFLIGPNYEGIFKSFMRGYLMDILLPMNLYLLLQISFRKYFTVIGSRSLGASFTFILGMAAELLQRNEIPFLGSTYDPIDILMYGIGIALGITIDLLFIDRLERNHKK